GFQSQRQPTWTIWEVVETAGFTRKREGVPERWISVSKPSLQPLGHLTPARNLSIQQGSSYGNTAHAKIVPELVPASSPKPAAEWRRTDARSADPNAAVLFANKYAGK